MENKKIYFEDDCPGYDLDEDYFARKAFYILKALDLGVIGLECVSVTDTDVLFKTTSGEWYIEVFFDCGDWDSVRSIRHGNKVLNCETLRDRYPQLFGWRDFGKEYNFDQLVERYERNSKATSKKWCNLLNEFECEEE